MNEKDDIRKEVWQRLREVAYPDSRFDYDFSNFIADFRNSKRCAMRISEMPQYRDSKVLFITPDNSLTNLRELALRGGKTYVMTTYGIRRGFLLFEGNVVSKAKAEFMATLDGAEVFGRRISLEDLAALKHIDMLVTGAAAVTMDGIRFGKGHGFFDVEWGIFTELKMIDERTVTVTVVDDVQLVNYPFKPDEYDTITDYIVTPKKFIKVKPKYKRPSGIKWDALKRELYETIPPLQELAKLRGVKV
ncbi:MAG: 5-formyltetrahydrofolate cyclo-ligase [Nitrososphaerota archaeon]|nr:5-formyltetrahydrofolate cyclo-ligase [Nitrososphaerota archaeon]MDG7041232.1 5-formyltetrahydrofolate cyclo-ligase [Nitrososphaerota archaeon]MDG7047079.1 5-formyltetrahydrofolate cyclo-ligase [Nitrososphaerota archaeon]